MLQSTISAFLAPVGKTAMGLIFALVLALLGDVAGRVFNLSIGYPWTQSVHQNIHFISIGVGAGIGAYLGWMNLERHWYFMMGLGTLVLAGGYRRGLPGSFLWPRSRYWILVEPVRHRLYNPPGCGGIEHRSGYCPGHG
jgi:hypothetical protein